MKLIDYLHIDDAIGISVCVLAFVGVGFLIWHQNHRTIEAPSVVVVDGCQYIQCPTYMGYSTLIHKGNCTNRIHEYE